jgi:hypothetical protein
MAPESSVNRDPRYSPSEQAAKVDPEQSGSFSIAELIPANSPWRLALNAPVRTDSSERGAAPAAGRDSHPPPK